jgi:hypothetical protein
VYNTNTAIKTSSDPTNKKKGFTMLRERARRTHLVALALMSHCVFLTFDEMSVKVGDDSCKHNGSFVQQSEKLGGGARVRKMSGRVV